LIVFKSLLYARWQRLQEQFYIAGNVASF
jgi:hypothetical protein